MIDMLTAAFASLGPDLLLIAGVGLGIGVTLFGLRVGYSMLKHFIHDGTWTGGGGSGRVDDAAMWKRDQGELRKLGIK